MAKIKGFTVAGIWQYTATSWHKTGRRITTVTEYTTETIFLIQRLSMALQKLTACMHGHRLTGVQNITMIEWDTLADIYIFLTINNYASTGFVLVGK